MSDDPVVWQAERRAILRDSTGVGAVTGALGVSFGAVAIAGGLDVWQTVVLSLFMFTGGSQFGLVGAVAGGGSPWAGAATAFMLGSRNALYGLRLAPILGVHGLRRVGAAQLVIDESSAMSMGRSDDRGARLGFYGTGLSVFVFWNLGTVAGAVGAAALADPGVLGLDAAAPAAFLALLAPRVRGREPWALALTAGAVALLVTPFVPAGMPVLVAAAVGVAFGVRPGRRRPKSPKPPAAEGERA